MMKQTISFLAGAVIGAIAVKYFEPAKAYVTNKYAELKGKDEESSSDDGFEDPTKQDAAKGEEANK